MRSALAVAVLLAMTWPHVTIMRCALMSDAERSRGVASIVSQHAHDGPDCRAAMACNSSMIEGTVVESVAQLGAPPLLHPKPTVKAPTAVVLATDPPPPRPAA